MSGEIERAAVTDIERIRRDGGWYAPDVLARHHADIIAPHSTPAAVWLTIGVIFALAFTSILCVGVLLGAFTLGVIAGAGVMLAGLVVCSLIDRGHGPRWGADTDHPFSAKQ